MGTLSHHINLPDMGATSALARAMAPQLHAGDSLLLEGPVGAGKTHFARALIQSILLQPEDVPSPTYTLVQTYDTNRGPLWHADLYRLSGSDEIEELGLTEAFDTAICLIEWPDRLGHPMPDALTIDLVPADDQRTARLSWTHSRWTERVKNATAHV